MKTKQIGLANMQGQLSRAEMKNILAGDESAGGSGYTCEWTTTAGVITAGNCGGPSLEWCTTQTQTICSQTPTCQSVCCY